MGLLTDLAAAAPVGSRWWRSTQPGVDLELVLAGADPDPQPAVDLLSAGEAGVVITDGRRIAVRLADRVLVDEVTRLAAVGDRRRSTVSDPPSCSGFVDEHRTETVSDRRGPATLAALLGARPGWAVRRTPDNPVFALLHSRARAAGVLRAAARLGIAPSDDGPGGAERELTVALLVGEEGSAYGLRGVVDAYARYERAGPQLPRGPEAISGRHRQAVTLAAATVGVLDPVLAEYGIAAPERI